MATNEFEIKTVFDAESIQQKVRELGARIDGDHPEPEPLFVSIVGGSVVFLADLIRAVSRPVRYETIQVVYSASGQHGDLLEIQYPISLALDGQRVVIVKDVVSTGVPESYLINQLQQRGAARVRIAALIDLPEERRADVVADYSVLTPKRVGTFVGYGLKYEGRFGNLSFLGRIVGDGESRAASAPL